jgi:hypothetical protein
MWLKRGRWRLEKFVAKKVGCHFSPGLRFLHLKARRKTPTCNFLGGKLLLLAFKG